MQHINHLLYGYFVGHFMGSVITQCQTWADTTLTEFGSQEARSETKGGGILHCAQNEVAVWRVGAGFKPCPSSLAVTVRLVALAQVRARLVPFGCLFEGVAQL